MTFDSEDEQADGEGATGKAPYDVGYGKPPVAHRFKKGRSGNPKGRPRKSKSFEQPLNSLDQLAKKYLLEEAYRRVTVREGEKVIQLPVIQAAFRAMGVSAMKGNRLAQREMACLVQAVEAEDRKSHLECLEAMVEYKCDWEREIEQARKFGRPEPHPIPHPEDIVLDFVNGRAFVCGPMTKEEKSRWDRKLDYRDHLQSRVSACAEKFATTRNGERRAHSHAWKLQQKLYDEINDDLPKRYRKVLNDRCGEDGASMPGQQRKLKWPSEDL